MAMKKAAIVGECLMRRAAYERFFGGDVKFRMVLSMEPHAHPVPASQPRAAG